MIQKAKVDPDLKMEFAQAKPGDFGIIGDPVEHSLSPALQNAALQEWWLAQGKPMGSPPVYHKFHVRREGLRVALELAQQHGLRGFNITIPHKERVCDFVQVLDVFSLETGSVNTVELNENELKGYNTDGYGFETSLKNDMGFDPQGKTAFVIGAGGTGKVILYQLIKSGAAKVFLWNRHVERAAALLALLKGRTPGALVQTGEDIRMALSSSDLVVNATSVGMSEKDGEPAPYLSYSATQIYFDVIYHRETRFLQKARAAGAKAVGGSGMLLYQGARAFEIWTKGKAPMGLMRKVLDQTMKEKGLIPIWPSDI